MEKVSIQRRKYSPNQDGVITYTVNVCALYFTYLNYEIECFTQQCAKIMSIINIYGVKIKR
jgi:hypothetical protein